jgi:uncharacterized protein YprB with RNaseH-like and TPR domain
MGLKEVINSVRCIHRHTVEEHPACFAQGKVIDNRKDKKVPWYQEPGMTIGYLDIETDNLKANFGQMLTWCLKEKGGDTLYSVITRNEILKYKMDKRIVEELVEAMRKFKIIVSYYGTRFDLPFIRSRALYHGLDFPEYGEIFHWDLYYTTRNKLCLHRNTLDTATHFLGIDGKSHIDWKVWQKAKYGDAESLQEVLGHNIGDVEILELLHEKLHPFAKWTKKSV